jgi:hypothetical protein
MEIIIQDKRCSKCQQAKPLEEFRNQRSGKYGKKNYCIVCDDENARRLYEKNRIKRIAQVTSWNREHKDKLPIYQKNFRERKKSLL